MTAEKNRLVRDKATSPHKSLVFASYAKFEKPNFTVFAAASLISFTWKLKSPTITCFPG